MPATASPCCSASTPRPFTETNTARISRLSKPFTRLGGYASVRRMENVLGWKPKVSITDGVARYVQWLQDTPQAAPGWLSESAPA